MNAADNSFTILVVEDNPVNLLLAEEVLQGAGYRTLGAVSAEQAEELIVAQLPDLVLMDIRLPGIDGLTLVRKLRSNAVTAGLPIVALTAQAMAGDEAEAIAAGCDGYVSKPLRRADLLQTVEGVMRLRQGGR
ncbi:MAG TPA: response regulator [Candidatus Micrarchaeaceae archaeon]|nr:response regulator [Candidatus Micrarchaeaceae archaeon]